MLIIRDSYINNHEKIYGQNFPNPFTSTELLTLHHPFFSSLSHSFYSPPKPKPISSIHLSFHPHHQNPLFIHFSSFPLLLL